MSEQKDTTLSELEEATQEGDQKSETIDTEDSSSESDQGGADDQELDEIITEKKTKSIDYAKQQEEVWAERIANDTTGEELKKFKENKSLKWLHQRVEKRLGIVEPNAPVKPDLGDFSKKMAEYEAQKENRSLLEKFKTLPVDQRKDINSKVRQAVKELGANPSKVLAKYLSEVSTTNQPTTLATINAGVRVATGSKTITMENLSKLPPHEYARMRNKIEKKEITLVA